MELGMPADGASPEDWGKALRAAMTADPWLSSAESRLAIWFRCAISRSGVIPEAPKSEWDS